MESNFAEAVDDAAAQRLRALVRYAVSNCPLYRLRIGREDVLETADLAYSLSQIPYLTREDLVRYPNSLKSLAVPLAECRRVATSGTSRDCATVLLDENSFEGRSKWIIDRLKYYDIPFDRAFRVAYISVRPNVDVAFSTERAYESLGETRIYFPFSKRWPSFGDFVHALSSFEPDLIITYPSFLQHILLLDLCDAKCIVRRAVFSMGEVLTDIWRSAFSRILGVPVFDNYGSAELGVRMFECREGHGYHYERADWIAEFLPTGEDHSVCELVVTDLSARAMPFIRYRTQDLVEIGLGECTCGIGQPIVKRILGREMDCLRLHDRLVRPLDVQRAFDIEGILDFQLTQLSASEFAFACHVLVWSEEIERKVRRIAAELLGAVSITVIRRQSPWTRTASKYRPVIALTPESMAH